MWINKILKPKKKKMLGLALGSGGAKGMAHIGVLKAFEEEGIAFDVVSGASIGSVVGGLYAKGFSAMNMAEMIENSDLLDFKKLLVYRLTGVGLEKIITDYLGALEFSELKIPFAAVAVDLDSGEEVVMKEGDLVSAMAASSAMPPYFGCVVRDGRRLVDGAFLNGIPADVARDLGADFVISVDLSSGRDNNNDGKLVLDDFFKGNKVPAANPTKKGYDGSDVMIVPDLASYRATNVSLKDEMFDLGYDTARRMMPEIKDKLVFNKVRKFN